MAKSASTINTTSEGVAIQGYDPVAYFLDDEPRVGDPQFSHEWQDATWHFANADHRDRFVQNPTRYAPAFGGFCALGRALGGDANGSPKRWRIEDDRLYLNKNLLAKAIHNLFRARIRKLAHQASGTAIPSEAGLDQPLQEQ